MRVSLEPVFFRVESQSLLLVEFLLLTEELATVLSPTEAHPQSRNANRIPIVIFFIIAPFGRFSLFIRRKSYKLPQEYTKSIVESSVQRNL